MSFQLSEQPHRSPVAHPFLNIIQLPRFFWSLSLLLALLAGIAAPAGAAVLFPHGYRNGEILTFSGGVPGKDYELRVAQPGGGIVKASEALLDVSFLDYRRVKIAPQNVAPDVYRAFYGPPGAGG